MSPSISSSHDETPCVTGKDKCTFFVKYSSLKNEKILYEHEINLEESVKYNNVIKNLKIKDQYLSLRSNKVGIKMYDNNFKVVKFSKIDFRKCYIKYKNFVAREQKNYANEDDIIFAFILETDNIDP